MIKRPAGLFLQLLSLVGLFTAVSVLSKLNNQFALNASAGVVVVAAATGLGMCIHTTVRHKASWHFVVESIVLLLLITSYAMSVTAVQ